MAMANLRIILSVVAILIIVFLFLFLWICKPWRYFSFPGRSIEDHDIEKPLCSNDLDLVSDHCYEATETLERANIQPLSFSNLQISQDDIQSIQTVKQSHSADDRKQKEAMVFDSKAILGCSKLLVPSQKAILSLGSRLSLEVISGSSSGLCCSVHSTDTFRLPLTIGRVEPSVLVLKDSEVSGRHALIDWNLNKLKWELVDTGSLNGTILNSKAIKHPDLGLRHWGEPVELESGDIITLGTKSKIYVQITTQVEKQALFGIGVASDPMAARPGGKKLPMEDKCYYEWPLPGSEQFGLFAIFDGHGGTEGAIFASKSLPNILVDIISNSEQRDKILRTCNASEELKDAFYQTETQMNHQYEGCTATVLLVWSNQHGEFFFQCANVGDSACIIYVNGKQINMTENHRITNTSERIRIAQTGKPLRNDETRLCGFNIGRMLGDKFLKEQDSRFISEPYISEVVHISKSDSVFVILASDGLWDVINGKKALQIILQARERCIAEGLKDSAEKIANYMLSQARTLKTRDNTTIIFLDFSDEITCEN